MKHFLYRFFGGLAFLVLIPIVITLLAQGSGRNFNGKLEYLGTTETNESEFDESILLGIVANEVSMDTEIEAMKAQAVVARTNCLRAMEKGEDFPEGLTKGEMMRMWGQEDFSKYYSQLESSIESTRGVAMVYKGEYIQADFHMSSAGYTRDAKDIYGNEEYPYLKSVDSRMDIPSKDFLKVMFYTPQEFVQKGGDLFSEAYKNDLEDKTAEDLVGAISVTQKDDAGYVKEVIIDGNKHSGEELRLIYDWNSSAFSLKAVEGEIRVVTKGLGHGLGLSLYGANQLAAEGLSYKDILKYFYTEIEFVTQYN